MQHQTHLQQQFEQRVRAHPDELLGIFRDLSRAHAEVKRLKRLDPKLAQHKLTALLHKVDALQRLPASVVPVSYTEWSHHLSRIVHLCNGEADALARVQRKWSAVAPRDDNDANDGAPPSWLRDWNDPTLQQPHVRQLLQHVVVPVCFPDVLASESNVQTCAPSVVCVTGGTATGKSHALQAMRKYLRKRPVRWVEWTAYDCPTRVKQVLDAQTSNVSTNEWTFYVTDRVTAHDLKDWAHASWKHAWAKHLRHHPRQRWVVLVTTDTTKDASQDECTSLLPYTDHVHFAPPNSTTLYHYLKKLVHAHYGSKQADGTRTFPPFARLPIVDELPQLAALVDEMCTHDPPPTFCDADRLFRAGVNHCASLALAANVVYGVPDTPSDTTQRTWTWYPKHSVVLSKLPDASDYRLLTPMRHDTLDWCPRTTRSDESGLTCGTDQTTFWNTQLLDTLSYAEHDRLVHVYIDPQTVEERTYRVIASFPVTTSVFPYHLENDFDRCYEWTVSLWLACVRVQPSLTLSADAQLRLDNVHATSDLCTVPQTVCAEWWGDTTCDALTTFPEVRTPFQVLYVEDIREDDEDSNESNDETSDEKPTDDTPILTGGGGSSRYLQLKYPAQRGGGTTTDDPLDDDPTPARFHVLCHGRSSVEIPEYRNGIAGDVDASTLRSILCVLCDRQTEPSRCNVCDVVQVKTYAGYAYYIDFADAPDTSLQVRAANDTTRVELAPRVQVVLPRHGLDLDDAYRMTTEADVDALTEAYPQAYKDIFREDENTWKLEPVRDPLHLRTLNRKYSNEIKCYLQLLSVLLRAKQRHYACLSTATRTMLDNTLIDLQNHVDYLLQLIAENDHTGKWNEVWSMSDGHPNYARYHPPEHDEIDKVIPRDLATEWLRRGTSFAISPRWLRTLYAVCSTYNDTSARDEKNGIHDVFDTWRHYVCDDVQTQTQWLYVKSTVDRDAWDGAQSLLPLLQRAFPAAGADDPAPQSNDPALTAFTDNDWRRVYTARTDGTTCTSLFHTLFRHASYIGHHNPTTARVEWYTFGRWASTDPLHATLRELHREPTLGALLAQTCVATTTHSRTHHQLPWLFALLQTSGVSAEHTYRMLYAHLLLFPTLHYWCRRPTNVLLDIQRQPVLDHVMRQYAYVHRHVYRHPLPLHGESPDAYTRHAVRPTSTVSMAPQASSGDKKVLDTAARERVRVFGLAAHHLADAWWG